MKIIVGMSGGVDSSVTAYLLKVQGHEVIGVSFQLWDRRGIEYSNTCCSIETINIAKSVAKRLGIEHHIIDVRDDFYRYIIERFCDLYVSGLTPNPCVLCNKYIKFDFLLKKAKEFGADMIATGHYARIKRTGDGRFSLRKGLDLRKDQAYFLYVMSQEMLSKTLFPLGELRKEETRRIAMESGLESAVRSESQEICFIGNGGYREFISSMCEGAFNEGDIVAMDGKVIGRHKGIAYYTIGQRKGLNIPSREPLYVINIEPSTNRIFVGSKRDAFKKKFTVNELNWVSIDSLTTPTRVTVKIRSTMQDVPATIIPINDKRVLVEFDEPQWAPAPGQSAVFYSEDAVIGGGIIESVHISKFSDGKTDYFKGQNYISLI